MSACSRCSSFVRARVTRTRPAARPGDVPQDERLNGRVSGDKTLPAARGQTPTELVLVEYMLDGRPPLRYVHGLRASCPDIAIGQAVRFSLGRRWDRREEHFFPTATDIVLDSC